MYIEQTGGTYAGMANWLNENPDHKFDLLLEIKALNASGKTAAATANIALTAAGAQTTQSMLLFKYAAIALGENPMTFLADDGLQIIRADGSTNPSLQIVPVTVTAPAENPND